MHQQRHGVARRDQVEQAVHVGRFQRPAAGVAAKQIGGRIERHDPSVSSSDMATAGSNISGA